MGDAHWLERCESYCRTKRSEIRSANKEAADILTNVLAYFILAREEPDAPKAREDRGEQVRNESQ